MSAPVPVEALEILPNRLSVAEFSPPEVHAIVGDDPKLHNFRTESFNWIASYLVEEAGLFESNVVDWFTNSVPGDGETRPIDLWENEDGLEEVFELAQKFKQENDEYLAEDDKKYGVKIKPRSHDVASYALGILYKSFSIAGAGITYDWLNPEDTQMRAIFNPDNDTGPVVRWKSNSVLEDFRITINQGDRTGMYYVVQHVRPNEKPLHLQSGVVEHFKGEPFGDSTTDSDLDGRPPSANDVAPFVIAVANETLNHSLKPMAAAA